VPLLLGAAGGYFSFRASYEHAGAALAEAVAVAEENTTKVLDTHVLVAARIGDLLAGLSDADVRAKEGTLHDQIAQQIKDLPQVAAAWVIDSNGRELVSARVYPVNRDLDHSGREDFRALQDSSIQTFIWALRARSLDQGDYQPYFTVSHRRPDPDGRFRGISVVAVSGAYFASFYNSLLGGSAQYVASVLREDGTMLARYPGIAPPAPPQQHDEAIAIAIADRATSGIIVSGSPFHGAGNLVGYKRLADYPVYVAIGRTRASIVRGWLESVAGYAVIGFAAAIGLMLLSLLALRHTRQEQLALAEARDAVAQRAAIEAQLHQAQRMEAVGLLTAGIAHDFNNLLTIVLANIAMLESDLETANPRRRKFIELAVSGCERASALSKRLLSYARREPTDSRPVDINKAVTNVSDLPWRLLGDNIVAKLRLGRGLWPVFVDPGQLENALLNLALNARDAMAGRGCLTIETLNLQLDGPDAMAHAGVTAGDHVAIFVSDTGCGMPQEVLEKAFDPFFTTKGAGKGTGLGLSQVYGFITRFGGHCTIDSEPGRGTTVKLFLPRDLGESDAVDADDGNATIPAGARLRHDDPLAAANANLGKRN
jgi:signal transduction histidine kinase